MPTDTISPRFPHLTLRPANARGWNLGESHSRARHGDVVVAEARSLRALGWTNRSIGDALGVSASTIQSWVELRRRAIPPARLIATRHAAPSLRAPLLALRAVPPEMRLPPRNPARHPQAIVDEARRLRALGCRPRDIAVRLGVNARTLLQWLSGRRRPLADSESPTE